MSQQSFVILGIESSCDDTSAAILKDNTILSNVTASQAIHEQYGGVVPELASRAHQQNIIPVVDAALKKAAIDLKDIDLIAFTQGPGLMGSLVVGTAFAKSLSLALNKPMVAVHHMHAHILAHFIDEGVPMPSFPFICMTVSGGHTQLVRIDSPVEMHVLGTTIDDAAGEAFDKTAKILGFPYPGGPLIDKYAKEGNPAAFTFAKPQVDGYNFSFSGLKTSVLYSIQKELAKNPAFIEENKADLCASIQSTILEILFKQLRKVSADTGIKDIAIAGGVSANSGLRAKLAEEGKARGWNVFIPKFEYCTDNAAMIAMAGKFLAENNQFASQTISANARLPFVKP
ncbi:tRNA (adenosine(37)-N6)-threonylcarbamoyltransferase complex transferase subunit TsaD [Fluviicola taffensis]|uniref:tRNA (adenosine(37)-N6)-threonylcarbamoyltransferase complex transferase subunit TsaD n=1 Tax=Fluviicola taffensis TaxID=191579 RepID=UPI003137962F